MIAAGRVAARMLRAGLNGDRARAVGVAAHSGKPPDELVTMARDHIQPTGRGVVAELSGPGLPTLAERIGG